MIAVMAMMMAASSDTSAAATKPYRILVPIGQQAGWFQAEDYPPISIAQKAEGIVHFAVEISPDGKPTACRIVKSSGNEGLDGATCKALMARARFHPLIDKKGQPTTATFDQVVRWRLPVKTATEEISDRTFTAHAIIAPTGEVVECTMSGSGPARFGTSGNNCGPFGERGFLANLMGADYAKARTSDIRLQVSYEGLPEHGAGRTPDFYLLLAESEIAVNRDGSMGKCTSVRPLQMQGRSVDLCNIVAMAPPRFQPGTVNKRAIFVLDLSVSYK
ncbi:energy transducer TonB [Sphingomonas sp. BIUV-7]|uniref:Energy transducer TonB n=1 Tax=Sphingomonas natans TaxID=3063330 RepID=A0ABT8YEW6_9SPHN|nr:energy transducer TonB [Sphingomonas sp. BIUV-7]MDO6416861.1 energy transducer TonB [Sphingomonas sp. BIUV-7]